jgi:serine/threonine protein kinase
MEKRMKKIQLAMITASIIGMSATVVNAQSKFEGFYGQVGVGFSSVTPSLKGVTLTPPAGNSPSSYGMGSSIDSTSSFAGAIGLGYTFAVAPKFTIGLGADYLPFNGESGTTFTINGSSDWLHDLNHSTEEFIRHEYSMITSLDHPNIVKAIEFFEEEEYFYVAMERVAGGELFDRIVQKTYFTEKEARDLMVIILNAVKYMLASNKIVKFMKNVKKTLEQERMDFVEDHRHYGCHCEY